MHAERRLDPVAAGALALALPLGALAATPARLYVAAAIACGVVVWLLWVGSARRPATVLAALWLFQLARTPVVAGLHARGGAGAAAGAVNQLTDLAAFVLAAALAWRVFERDGVRRDVRFLVVAGILAAVGLASSMVAAAPLRPTAMGLWLGIKFWVLVGLAVALPWRREEIEPAFRVVLAAGAVVAALGILDFLSGGGVAGALHSNVHVTPMGTFRSNAAQSVYASPNEYNLAMSLLAALALARAATAPSLRRVGLALLFVAAAVVSLRLKAVLSVGAVFALVVAVQMLQGRRGALALALVGALCLGAVVAGEGGVIRRQVAVYAGSNESARAALYRAGTHIAEQRFPLGAGFGRFGTAPSRNPYSTVYDEEGVSDVWGLSRRFDRFVADTSWPAVLGETGISGLLVWIAGLAMLGALAVRRLREDGGFAPLALLGVLVVIVVDSSGDSTLFSWNTITTLALVVAATLAGARSRPA